MIELLTRPPKSAPIPRRPARTTISAKGVGSPRSRSQKSAGAHNKPMKPARRKGTKRELAARRPATMTTIAANAIKAFVVECATGCVVGLVVGAVTWGG